MNKKKRAVAIIRNTIIILLSLIVFLMLISFIIHKVSSANELKMLSEEGYINKVSVGEYELNVDLYGNENSEYTFVGLAGMGSNDYAVTVKPLMQKFSDEYRIAVIDRAGYGMSDDTKIPQTIDRQVTDYRTALKNCGCDTPYILFAHSYGGDLATYWESRYPDEIAGVVYFDPDKIPGNPDIIDNHDDMEVWWEDVEQDSVTPFLQRLGLVRMYVNVTGIDVWTNLSDNTCSEYSRAFCMHSMATDAMNSESLNSKESLQRTAEAIVTNDIPKLYIDAAQYTKADMEAYFSDLYASGLAHFDDDINPENQESMNRIWAVKGKYAQQEYNEFIKPYMDKLGGCQYVNIPGDHYIFAYKRNEVAKAIEEFLTNF